MDLYFCFVAVPCLVTLLLFAILRFYVFITVSLFFFNFFAVMLIEETTQKILKEKQQQLNKFDVQTYKKGELLSQRIFLRGQASTSA